MRHIARWQASEQRDQPPSLRFRSGAVGSADESLWFVEWDAWDADIEINVHAYEERRVLYSTIRERLGADAGTAIAELVVNALHHGYRDLPGTISVRIRHEELARRVEVEDHGVGGLTQEAVDSSRNGLAVVRGIGMHASMRHAYPTGTIISRFAAPQSRVRTTPTWARPFTATPTWGRSPTAPPTWTRRPSSTRQSFARRPEPPWYGSAGSPRSPKACARTRAS